MARGDNAGSGGLVGAAASAGTASTPRFDARPEDPGLAGRRQVKVVGGFGASGLMFLSFFAMFPLLMWLGAIDSPWSFVPFLGLFVLSGAGVILIIVTFVHVRGCDEQARAGAAPRRARVLTARESIKGRIPCFELLLDVPHADGFTYRVAAVARRDSSRAAWAQAGREVWVRVNPGKATDVEVDWDATRQYAPVAQAAAIPHDLRAVTLTCTSCGAKLQLAGRMAVDCPYCHTENHVVRS